MRALFTTSPGGRTLAPARPLRRRRCGRAAMRRRSRLPGPRAPSITALGFRCFPAGEDERTEEMAQQRREQDGGAILGPTAPPGPGQTSSPGSGPSAAFLTCPRCAGTGGRRSWSGRTWSSLDASRPRASASPMPPSRSRPGAPDCARWLLRRWITSGRPSGCRPTRTWPCSTATCWSARSRRASQDPAAPLPPTAHALRSVIFDRSGAETLPAWMADLANWPTVYVTLGTLENRSPGIFPAIIAGLRDEPLNIIVTVGRDQDPADFGPQSSNVHIERYIPQSLLLPHCDLVVSHAGFNSVLGALAHGLPQVVIPLSADQPDHARRCVMLGVGRVIQPDELSPEAVRQAVRAMLADPTYRKNATQLRDEMVALPGPEHGVALLERLAVEQRPLVATSETGEVEGITLDRPQRGA